MIREGSRVRVGSRVGTVDYLVVDTSWGTWGMPVLFTDDGIAELASPENGGCYVRARVVFDGSEEASAVYAVYPVRALTLL